MKNVRDIRLLAIGFVAGMVLCAYILSLDEPGPAGTPSMTVAQTAPLAPALRNGAVPPATEVRYITLFERWAAPRDQRMRIEPLLRVEPSLNIMPGAVPGAPSTPSVQSYDLIDLNYVPDFKLPD